jgi:hypothetical protein
MTWGELVAKLPSGTNLTIKLIGGPVVDRFYDGYLQIDDIATDTHSRISITREVLDDAAVPTDLLGYLVDEALGILRQIT